MPRILLIEDDTSIQRFVEFALEDMGAELLITDTVKQGLQYLEEAPVDLILTDLMLPGESGITLLERLRESPDIAPQTKVVVFSAGLTASVKTQLESLGVWRMLSKPISVMDLLHCVEEGLSRQSSPPVATTQDAPPAPDHDRERHAIETHFNGDTQLFLMYRQACLTQFSIDIEAGNLASQNQDLPALRRMGHSLKTVLLTLAEDQGAQLAKALEQLAEQEDLPSAQQQWGMLRCALQDAQQRHRPSLG
ncbi:MAG: response regulator [Curvibacter sp.]|nr:MAG: response regulator [Curvibacter sp.]